MEKEAIAARLVSLQLQDAAAELQLLKETYWLMLVDPMTLEQEVQTQQNTQIHRGGQQQGQKQQ